MKKKKVLRIQIVLIIVLLSSFISISIYAQETDRDDANNPKKLGKVTARIDEAIGVMNKGQLTNLTMNYGQITDTRLCDVGNAPTDDFYNFRYPKTKPYGGMNDDFALCFAIEKNSKNGDNGNFIDGYTSDGNEDWIAMDGSLGLTHYDGSGEDEQIFYTDGITPYLAHSDLEATWPIDADGNHFWPGYFRRDPSTGKVYEGEFVSDRDVYGVYTDANNVQGDVLGLKIEQMSYCYGRPYAEDFQFYEFFIHNTSGDTIKDAWFGHYHDPDCSDYGDEILITPIGHTFTDQYPIIMNRDIDGDIGGATNPNSLGRYEEMNFGVIILETPKNLGITDFHYFTDTGPTYDEILWPIISSKPNDPDIGANKAEYFHGANPRIDDLSTITAPIDFVYIASTGSFDLAPDDTVKFTIGVVVGDTDEDFMINSDMAIKMFEKGFVGPEAPPGPNLRGVASDQKVTLYWDDTSELKPDPLTGDLDFEGYKIYRSEDGGVTWGDKITDSQGSVVGYVPLVQFDKDNNISGTDPINPSNNLGENTGLQYKFVDNMVKNGVTYSYTVTAYDQGDASSNVPSFETAKGVGSAERHFVSIVPQPDPIGKIPAEIYSLNNVTGKGNGIINFEIIDPDVYSQYKLDNDYVLDPIFKIIFDGFPATEFSVYDSTANTLLQESLEINNEILPPITDIGVKITIESEQEIGGIKSLTDVAGINVSGSGNYDSTNSWYVSVGEISTSTIDVRSNDYELRFTADGSMAYSIGATPVGLMTVPFEVWRTKPDTAQIICEYRDNDSDGEFDVNEQIYLCNVDYPSITPSIGDSITVAFPDDFPVQVLFDTANGGNLPLTGQELNIECYSSYSDGSGFSASSKYFKGDNFIFQIDESSIDVSMEADSLDNVRVVPNPYVVTSLFDPKENVRSLKFMYLPEKCDIYIYTMSGVKVKKIIHDDGSGIENWNLTNNFGQDIGFGVYLFMLKTPSGNTATGKFAIIK